MKTKKPGALVPILPLTFIVGYQGDLAYGDKIKRVQGKFLLFSYHLIFLYLHVTKITATAWL